MKHLVYGLALLLLVGCGDDDVTYTSENCAVVTDGNGERSTLCCRVTCTAEYDYDDYRESCTEATTCTTATGAPCAPSLGLAFQAPVCLY